MRVLHCCLANFYIDNYLYQENLLPKMNSEDGHTVKIIASTESFIDDKIDTVKPGTYVNEYGIPVVRLPYKKILPKRLMQKLRIYKNLTNEINKFEPDVILVHGVQFLALNDKVK